MIGDFLDLDVVQGAPLAAGPFRFALWRDPLRPAVGRRLTEEFPTDGFVRSLRRAGGSKTYSFLVRKAVDKNRRLPSCDELSPAWQAFISELAGPGYRALVGEMVGERLDDCAIDVGFFVFTDGNYISIHTDHLIKAATNVLYFSHAWEPECGGELCLYRRWSDGRFEAFDRLLPQAGNGMLLVPGAASWHGVNAVTPAARGPRLTLQIETWRTLREQT
ncbi:SM-20-related protein [Paraburkholderia sp. Clong3]|uniref:2OG-Fe(II) oxygenase family protein n=1 Tax=Paraburkholderia sp. Clong3 TaxID=2991061 RepID=UPI003D2152FB